MLEQCHARFLPQAVTKQKRRVDGGGQYRSSYRLRQIVMRDEIGRACLKVHLEACIARFHHDVVVRDLKFVQTFDVNGEGTAPKPYHAPVKFMVAGNWRKVFQGQI